MPDLRAIGSQANAALFGALRGGRFDAIVEADWDAAMAVNVKGIWHCCKAAVQAMRSAGGGSIINLASLAATYGTPLAGPYFDHKWRGKTVGALFQYASTRMPPSRKGSLPPETYADITAHILSTNGFAAGDSALPADAAELDRMIIGPKAQ